MGKAEAKIEEYLKKEAEASGFLCYKFTAPGRTGVPDRVLIGYGQTIFVETKSPVGTVRPLQKVVIKDMREHGAAVYVIDDRAQVRSLLQHLVTQVVDIKPGAPIGIVFE